MQTDEKLKTGYAGANSMVAAEASVIWSTFNGMVSANAFLIALIGAGLKFFPQVKWGAGALSLAGIFICVAWFLTLKRQFAYFSYWIAWVRSIEQRALSPEVQTLALGRLYGQSCGEARRWVVTILQNHGGGSAGGLLPDVWRN